MGLSFHRPFRLPAGFRGARGTRALRQAAGGRADSAMGSVVRWLGPTEASPPRPRLRSRSARRGRRGGAGPAGRGGAGPGRRPTRPAEVEEDPGRPGAGRVSGRSGKSRWARARGDPWALLDAARRGGGVRTPRRAGIGRNGSPWMPPARALGFYPLWSALRWGPGGLAPHCGPGAGPSSREEWWPAGMEQVLIESLLDFTGLIIWETASIKGASVTLGVEGIWTFTPFGWVVLTSIFVKGDAKK